MYLFVVNSHSLVAYSLCGSHLLFKYIEPNPPILSFLNKTHYLISIVISSLALVAIDMSAQTVLPYKNPALPVKQRVSDLLQRMTLEEKVEQLCMKSLSALKQLHAQIVHCAKTT